MPVHKNDRTNTSISASKLAYILIGGGMGAAVALLFAPKKGRDLRHDISDSTRKGYDGTLDLARRFKDQSSGLYQSLVDKVKIFEEGADEIRDLPTKLSNTPVNRPPESDPYENLRARPRERGRRSTAIF